MNGYLVYNYRVKLRSVLTEITVGVDAPKSEVDKIISGKAIPTNFESIDEKALTIAVTRYSDYGQHESDWKIVDRIFVSAFLRRTA